MKLIDKKLVEEAVKKIQKSPMYKNGDEYLFKAGVDFAEQQLKQKMIEFADWTSTNFTSLDGIHCKIGENKWITSEQLLEGFINQQK